MPTSTNFIIPARQYFVPDHSILTLDQSLQGENVYHLNGLLPQATTIKVSRTEEYDIRVVNHGALPLVYISVDNPYRFTKLTQNGLIPGQILIVPNKNELDQHYWVFNAVDGNKRSKSGKIYPLTVRLCLRLSEQNIHVEFYAY